MQCAGPHIYYVTETSQQWTILTLTLQMRSLKLREGGQATGKDTVAEPGFKLNMTGSAQYPGAPV